MPKDDGAPIYLQLRDDLARQITSGRLAAGARLPSERELAALMGAARMTVREALRMLEGEGLVYREERRGYFVSAPRLRYDPTKHVNTYRLIQRHGGTPGSITIGWSRNKASRAMAAMMACPEKTPLLVSRALVLMNERKISYQETNLLASALPGFSPASFEPPITDFLAKRFGLRTKQTGFRARPTHLSGTAAEILGVKTGTPGLAITLIKEMDGKVLQVDQDFWLTDVLEIVVGRFPKTS